MAELAPFRGILYDLTKVEASKVIAPPYDVIDEKQRKALEGLDPHNVVRLILPQGPEDTRYQTAAQTFQSWLADGTLHRDARPAFYRYHQVFSSAELGGRKITRRGFITGVKLHPYDDNVVLPHERTLRGPKMDRLLLMRAARAHFSQIFGLYRDPGFEVDTKFTDVERRRPDLEGITADNTVHRLWRVMDRETIAAVGRLLAPHKVYIADGHHRYETMLALRDELRAAGANSPRASSEYATFFLANMDDHDLVILPTHRLVHSLAGFDQNAMIEQAKNLFTLVRVDGGGKNAAVLKQALAEQAALRPTVGVVFPGQDAGWLFALKVDPEEVGVTGHRSVIHLDVTILHALVFERLLKIDTEAQELQKNIVYVKDTQDALDRVSRGEAQIGFIMHPTRVDQVRQVAEGRATMPQKSTFFFPKTASGLVINPINPDEDLDKAY